MMTLSSRAAATALASLLLISSAFAQTTTPATPAPATKMAPAEKKAEPATKMAPSEKKAEKPRTAASLECSKEADTKGVHGKQRKKFMSECKNAAKDDAAKSK
jgi:psiF repeat